MKLAIGEGFMFKDVPLDRSLREVSKVGFRSLEILWGTRVDGKSSDEQVKTVRRTIDRHGMDVAALIGLAPIASVDEKVRSEAVKLVRRQVQIAEMLGTRMITSEMSGGTSRQQKECIAAFRRSIGDILPALEKADISMSFEPHPGDFIEESNLGADVLRSLKSRRVGYLYCCPHTFVLGKDPAPMIEYAGDLLNHVHVADTHKLERIVVSLAPRGFASLSGVPEFEGIKAHEHLTPGHGEVPFDRVFGALRKIGYRGTVSCIPFSPDDPVGAARESFAVVNKYLKGRR